MVDVPKHLLLSPLYPTDPHAVTCCVGVGVLYGRKVCVCMCVCARVCVCWLEHALWYDSKVCVCVEHAVDFLLQFSASLLSGLSSPVGVSC